MVTGRHADRLCRLRVLTCGNGLFIVDVATKRRTDARQVDEQPRTASSPELVARRTLDRILSGPPSTPSCTRDSDVARIAASGGTAGNARQARDLLRPGRRTDGEIAYLSTKGGIYTI